MMLPRFLRFENYKTTDVKEFLADGRVEVYLERDFEKGFQCHRCGQMLSSQRRGDYFLRVETLSIMGYRTYLNCKSSVFQTF